MLRLVEEKDKNIIHVSEMKDGDVGVIVHWEGWWDYVGDIIQFYEETDTFVTLGANSSKAFTHTNQITQIAHPDCKVRIIKKGEKLELV